MDQYDCQKAPAPEAETPTSLAIACLTGKCPTSLGESMARELIEAAYRVLGDVIDQKRVLPDTAARLASAQQAVVNAVDRSSHLIAGTQANDTFPRQSRC